MLGTRRAALVIDEEGIVRYRHVHTLGLDFQDTDDLQAALAALAAQGAGAGLTTQARRARLGA